MVKVITDTIEMKGWRGGDNALGEGGLSAGYDGAFKTFKGAKTRMWRYFMGLCMLCRPQPNIY